MGLMDIFKGDKKKPQPPLAKPELAPAPLPPVPPPIGQPSNLPPLSPPSTLPTGEPFPPTPPWKPDSPQTTAQDTFPAPPPLPAQTPQPPMAELQENTNANVNPDELSAALDGLELPQMDTIPAQSTPEPQAPTNVKSFLDLPPVPEIPKEWDANLPNVNLQVKTYGEPALEELKELDEPPKKEDQVIKQIVSPQSATTDIPQAIPSLETFTPLPRIDMNRDAEMEKLRDQMDAFTPHFIKVEDFSNLSATVAQMDGLLKESERIFLRMKEIKEFKDKKLDEWQKTIDDIQRKMVYLDNKLFEVA